MRIVLALCLLFLALPCFAQTAVDCSTGSGGFSKGCVKPKITWTDGWGRYYNDRYAAAKGVASKIIELSQDNTIKNLRYEKLISSPEAYNSYGNWNSSQQACTSVSSFVQNHYTKYVIDPSTLRFGVVIVGHEDNPYCQNREEYKTFVTYNGTDAWVKAALSCPQYYSLTRPKSSIEESEYFGYLCVRYSSIYKTKNYCPSPISNPAGACFTKFPVDLVSRYKKEYVEDMKIMGPRPIIWSRTYSSSSASMNWEFMSLKTMAYTTDSMNFGYVSFRMGAYGSILGFKSVSPINEGNVTWKKDVDDGTKDFHHVSLYLENISNTPTFVLRFKDGSKEFYQNNRLTWTEDNQGFVHHFFRDSLGRVNKIEDDFGNYIQINYKSFIDNILTYFEKTYSVGNNELLGASSTTQENVFSVVKPPNSSYDQTFFDVQSVTDGQRSVFYTWENGFSSSIYAPFLTKVLDVDGHATYYRYGESLLGVDFSASYLTGKEDDSGFRQNYYYFSSNNPIVTQEWQGDKNQTDPRQKIKIDASSTTDQNGNMVTFFKETSFDKIKTFSAKCAWCQDSEEIYKSYTYDTKGNPVTLVDFAGNTEKRTYDAQSRLTSKTVAFGTPLQSTKTFTYNNDDILPSAISEQVGVTGFLGTRVTNLTYNARHQVTKKDVSWNNETRTTMYEYNNNGLLIAVITPLTQTGFIYDNRGRITQIVEAVGTPLERSMFFSNFSASGQPQTVVFPDGTQMTMTYTPSGKLLTQIYQSQTRSISYDLSGLVSSMIEFDGTRTDVTYSQSKSIVGLSKKTSGGIEFASFAFVRDGMDNVLSVEAKQGSALQYKKSFTYNALGLVAKEIDALNQETNLSYTPNGDLSSITDPLGRQTSFAYNALRLVSSQTNPASQVEANAYSVEGDTVSKTDTRGNTTQYTYNGFGKVLSVNSPDSGLEIFSYNAEGLLVQKTDARGVVTTIIYDPLSRPVQKIYDVSGVNQDQPHLFDGGAIESFAYDSCLVGKLCAATDPQGTTNFTYDAQGRVISKTRQDVSLGSLTLSQAYDSVGRIANKTLPSGKVLNYNYTPSGDLSSISLGSQAIVSGMTYNALGNLTHQEFGFGFGQNFVYNQNQDLETISFPGGNKNYSFDAAGQLIQEDLVTYSYNALSEITNRLSPTGSSQYSFDPNGNILTKNSESFAVSSQSNKIVEKNGTTVNYDSSGNIVGMIGEAIKYSAQGRVGRWENGATTSMYYDPFGSRVKAIVTGTNPEVFQEFYDFDGTLIGVYDGTGQPKEELVTQGFNVLATIRNNNDVFYVLSDHLSSPRAIFDQTGQKVWSWNPTDIFGDTAPNEYEGSNRFVYNGRFQGQRFDETTNSLHNGFRTYSPKLGRYMQSDPLGLNAGMNTYAYVGNNPVGGVDPWGLIQRDKYGAPIIFKKGIVKWKNGRKYQALVLRTDYGSDFIAYKQIGGISMGSLAPFIFDGSQNCHGNAFDIPYWVEDPSVIYKDEYHRVSHPAPGDILRWRGKNKSGDIIDWHSAMYINSRELSGKNGSFPAIDFFIFHSKNFEIYRKNKGVK